jgi:hypothetical protein
VKVIIVGDPGVGKHDVAKGADICVPFKSLGVSLGKKINMDKKVNYKLTLIFWTLTKGRPRLTTYFNGAGAAIIVGDLVKKRSIKKMQFWADSIRTNVGKIPMFFIGTRNNLKLTKNIEQLAELAEEYNSDYFILTRTQENGLKIILKSIAKHLGNNYFKLMQDHPEEFEPFNT